MGKRVVDDASLAGVADAIRAKTGGADELAFPERFSAGVDEVFAAGEKSEYDRFWDLYQDNGNRTLYEYAFAGNGWNPETFKPKYVLTNIKRCDYMFARMNVSGGRFSLVELLENAGVTLDTSNSENHIGMFFEATGITEIPHIDLSKSLYATNLFNYCVSLRKVEITVAANTVPNYSGWFNRCDSLEDLTVNGVIDKSGMYLQPCHKLSKASITSVINSLSSDTCGLTVTLSLTAVNNAFETSEGAADGSTSEEWAALAATKSNWTISLI